jgi:hypothetical protein
LTAACQVTLQGLASGSDGQPREASVNQSDRGVSLTTHPSSKAERGKVVVRTVVSDANDKIVGRLVTA